MKMGDIVWVNESKMDGTLLLHEWYGKIVKIDGIFITIKDTDPKSPDFRRTFIRNLNNIEKK